jgi:hypothetical protein
MKSPGRAPAEAGPLAQGVIAREGSPLATKLPFGPCGCPLPLEQDAGGN